MPCHPGLAELLRAAGHDARHVRDRQMQQAADPGIFRWTVDEDRVLVSADTDFGTLLAFHRAASPLSSYFAVSGITRNSRHKRLSPICHNYRLYSIRGQL
jgi:hypothetical protein